MTSEGRKLFNEIVASGNPFYQVTKGSYDYNTAKANPDGFEVVESWFDNWATIYTKKGSVFAGGTAGGSVVVPGQTVSVPDNFQPYQQPPQSSGISTSTIIFGAALVLGIILITGD